MKYILIEYPKCSTCQKAKKFLTENNIDFETRNIVTETPTIEELKEWLLFLTKCPLGTKYYS